MQSVAEKDTSLLAAHPASVVGYGQMCTRCVMDMSAQGIIFDDIGVCNYCTDFLRKYSDIQKSGAKYLAFQSDFIAQIKRDGVGKKYDCIVGVSGGVDSSYVLYLAIECGLRPLAVHLDNGWNSELATHNISNLVSQLAVDLYTHVIDWEENRDLQRAFIDAHVVDIELLMDNAMLSLNYSQASKYGLKYILSGNNFATEGMRMPEGWYQHKFDKYNIRQIHKRFGVQKIKTHKCISTLDYVWYEFFRKIRRVPFLDYFSYNKAEALKILEEEVGYKPYPYKHYESIFTRFYQAYILPRKFGYDKRKVHLSSLVVSNQMTRDEALELLSMPVYSDPQQEKSDYFYVLKKLGFSEQEFSNYINSPAISHAFYGSERSFSDFLVKIYKVVKRLRYA